MRGQKITPHQVEALKQFYAETGNVAAAARQAGIPYATAAAYVKNGDEFDKLRVEKRADIIDEIAKARLLYLAHLSRPETIAGAEAKDAATVFGILTDKHQLLTGKATERREHMDIGTAREDLKRRLDRMARRTLNVVDGTDDSRAG